MSSLTQYFFFSGRMLDSVEPSTSNCVGNDGRMFSYEPTPYCYYIVRLLWGQLIKNPFYGYGGTKNSAPPDYPIHDFAGHKV